jgi:hypothetical protein
MKMKIDLSKFKMKHHDGKIATLIHPEGHEFRVAINALHPENRKNLETLAKHNEKAPKAPSIKSPMQTPPKESAPQQMAMEAKGGAISKPKMYADGTDNVSPDDVSGGSADYAQAPDDSAGRSGVVSSQDAAPLQVEAIDPNSPDAAAPSAQQPQPQKPMMAQAPNSAPSSTNPPNPPSSGVPQAGAQEGYESDYRGKQAEAAAIQSQGARDEAALKAKGLAAQNLNDKFNLNHSELVKHQLDTLDDIKNQHIDFNRYQGSRTTGQKIATGVSLMLGGIAGGINGSGGNVGMDFLNRQIERDIETQKAQLNQKQTLYSSYRQMGMDDLEATQMTRALMNDKYAADIQASAAKASGPLAQARAQQAIGQLQQQSAGLIYQQAMRNTLMGKGAAGSQPGSMEGQDPASFVPMVVPKEHQAKVFGEIEAAQNTRRMGDTIMDQFDKAAQDVRPFSGGRLKNVIPGTESAYVGGLHQAMQPTFKDLEGTVRQAAMENTFNNITPHMGNSDKEIGIKRQALVDYLKSKASAPTAKGFGIDLDRFSSTTTRPQQSPETKTMQGAQYQKVAGGWKKIK